MRWTGALLIGLAAGLSACAGVPGVQPSVDSVEPRIEGLDLDGLDVVFDVNVSNPLLSVLQVPRFRWDLDVQGRTLASGRKGLKTEFPAAGVGTVSIPARISYRELAAVYGDLSGRDEADYRLSGLFKVPLFGGTIDLPFEHRDSLPIVRVPEVSVESIDTSDLSVVGGTVRVTARVTNPNSFPLDLNGLGYSLGFGTSDVASLRTSRTATVPPGGSRALELTGSVSAADALSSIVAGGAGEPWINATGAVETPYGELRLP